MKTAPFPYFLLLTLLCSFTSCQKNSSTVSLHKIIGGRPVAEQELEHVVAFKRDELTVCTGTLIRSDLVLTAAHCFEKTAQGNATGLANLKVVTGNVSHFASSQFTSSVTEIKIHPQFWRDHSGAMDFAYAKIDPPITSIRPAQLPHSRAALQSVLDNASKLVISGFGLTTLKLPQEGELPAYGIKHVAEALIQYKTGSEIYAGTREADTCSGDSGGPAFLRVPVTSDNPEGLILAGVTSRGPMPCASDFEAGAYGNVSSAVCWLHSAADYRLDDLELKKFCLQEFADEFTAEDELILATEDFEAACENPNLSATALRNLALLLRKSHFNYQPNTLRNKPLCEAIGNYIFKVKILELENQSVKQLNWLKFANNLEVLIAPHNRIATIQPLLKLPNFTYLDIRNNSLADVSELDRLPTTVKIFGKLTQSSNIAITKYRELAEKGAALNAAKRSLIIILRDMLAHGNIERKSRDLAMKRQLNLEDRGIRSIEALTGLENLEVLNIAYNPDVIDWNLLLTLPRLKLLRFAVTDMIPDDVLKELILRDVALIQLL